MASSRETQEAIRRQALEMQDNIRELQKFAEQARKKDAALKAAAARRPKAPAISGADSDQQDAGTRSIAAHHGDVGAGTRQRSGKSKPDAGFTFDRSSDSASADSTETRDTHRERGNALFKDGKYGLAREAYTASLGVKTTHLAFANRAMASLKLRDFAAAEADSTSAIDLEPGYIKAYQRRAAARAEQGNHTGAIADLEYAVRLQPGSKPLVAERAAAIDRYHAETGTTRPDQVHQIQIRDAGDGGTPAATPAGPAASAAIQERAGSAMPAAVQPTAIASPTEPAQQASPTTLPASPAALPLPQRPSARPGNVAVQGLPSPSAPAQSPPDTAAAQPDPPVHTTSSVLPVLANGREVASKHVGSPPHEIVPVSTTASTASAPQQNGFAATVLPAESAPVSAAIQPFRPGSGGSGPVKLKRPTNGLDFERTWRSLAGRPEQQAQFLLLLRPQQLPTLLKASLTAPLLASLLPPLLSLLAEDCDADHAVDLLVKLPDVPRFDLAVMSLSGPGKAALSVLWDERSRNAAGGDPVNKVHLTQRLANLKPKYRL